MKKYVKFVIFIVIIAVVIIAFNFKGVEKEESKQSDSNTTNITNTQSDITNNSKNTSNENNIVENEKNEVDLSSLTEEEKNELGKDRVEDFLKVYKNSSPKGILVTTGLLEENHEFAPEDYVERFYAKTGIKYEDFKNKMLNYMSDELFTKYFDGLGFKEIEGELAVSDVGEETNTYNVTSLKFVENQGDKKVYNISFTNNETGETENAKIVVVEKDNNYIVANYEKE